MAAYATPGAVRSALSGSQAGAPGTAADLEDDILLDRVAVAQAQVDAALAGRYAVPFREGRVPRLVADITVAIACWFATLTYYRTVDLTEADPVVLRYKWATDLLDKLNKGSADLQLDSDGDGEPDTSYGGGVGRAINTIPRIFDLDDFYLTDRHPRRRC